MVLQSLESTTLIYNRPLKIERKRRGWTQARLAKVMGVATRTVIRWEHGSALPHPTHRIQLESLFGRTAKELGLSYDTNESGVGLPIQTTLPPLPYQTIPEFIGQEPLLADTASYQEPGMSHRLLGRAGLLTQIKGQLFTSPLPFTTIHGSSGIGKTTLTAVLANDQQVQAHFCNGILWAPLGPQPDMLSQLKRWATQLGITSNEIENPENWLSWERALRSAISTRQMLLIIDDVWTVEDGLALQIGGPRCRHLVTTRQSQIASAFSQQHAIMVPELEEADGLALLAHYIPPLLIQQDPQAAQSLMQALNCSPLALTLVGKSLASSIPANTEHIWPLRAALAQLSDTQSHLRLSKADTSERSLKLAKIAPFSLYSAIAMCIERLSPEAQATLCTLAIFPPKPHSFSEEAALIISQQPKEILDQLQHAGLLEYWGAKRYSLHQAIAHYVRTQAKPQ